MSGDGKRSTAPCGHPGRHVIGNYVKCDIGCDDVNFDDEKTDPGRNPNHQDESERPHGRCPYCNSKDIDWFILVWSLANGSNKHCWDCGRLFS